MITFRTIAAALKGSLVRTYFTENRPEQEQAPVEPLTPGRDLLPGEQLTSYFARQDERATWRGDMPANVAAVLGIDQARMPKDAELDRLFEAKRADTGEAWSKSQRTVSA